MLQSIGSAMSSGIVKPAYERLLEVQLTRPYLHVDETRWPMLDGTKNWQIWDVVSDVGVYHAIRDGCDAKKADDLPRGYIVRDHGRLCRLLVAREEVCGA